MERLNDELRLATHELSLLLDLSNLLAAPLSLHDRLHSVLAKIVDSLDFADAGLILLNKRETGTVQVQVSTGFATTNDSAEMKPRYPLVLDLGEQCVTRGIAMCRHLDGEVIEFDLEEALTRQECQQYSIPMSMIGLPLTIQQRVVGCIVLAQPQGQERRLIFEEFKFMLGIVQQLGLSIENALLHQAAQQREKMLGELLHQVVGAQEAERQRISRELHDVTGQSLTAIALGLRGVETMLADDRPDVSKQIKELKLFGTTALGELRHFVADLRPPQLDDLGLVAALQWYIQAFEMRHTIQIDLVLEGDQTRLPSEYETVLFRIVQEALINIAKHAKASRAMVKLEMYPAQICASIRDNGCGFNPEAILGGEVVYTGWGLLGIRERTLLLGGQYEIDSAPGSGTQIQVCIPLRVEISNVKNTIATG
jgi:signal transduction histidine kinase